VDDGQVVGLLRRALEAIETAKIPDDLRESAFAAALGLLTGQSTSDAGGGDPAPIPAETGGESDSGQTVGGGARTATGSPLLDRVASGLEVDDSLVVRVFAEKNGVPELSVKTNRLPRTDSAGAHDIALLVMAARQLSKIEDSTEGATLRDACKTYGKLDQSNFSKHMKALDRLVRTEGRGQTAKRTLTRPGIEKAAELVKQYADET
jgi:hypothetical protein